MPPAHVGSTSPTTPPLAQEARIIPSPNRTTTRIMATTDPFPELPCCPRNWEELGQSHDVPAYRRQLPFIGGLSSVAATSYSRWAGSLLPPAYPSHNTELNGDDLRRDPLEVRKATLASILAKAAPGLRLNEHLEHKDGEVIFRHACKLGLEGIVSKRKDSSYRSGRSPDWLKMKNPACEAVKREEEEDWGR
jgi:ATP dependent DNA ligase domain